jgi:fructuronate reductase
MLDVKTSPRLSDATLGAVKPGVQLPAYDRAAAEIGVVHLGPGAFHRAHQAWYFDELLKRDPRWAISAASLRSPGVHDALAPQDGLYALAEIDEHPSWRVIGAIKEVLVAEETPQRLLDRLAAPPTKLVTLTVTEKGYALAGDGTLDFDHPDIVHDLATPVAPRSAVGWIVAGLRRRREAGLQPYTVVSCDNLADNGRKLAAAATAFAARFDPDLARWIEGEARFPSTMVDSITPATDDTLRTRALEVLGVEDAWPVQREPFVQWVVENVFPDGGPDWASVGVTVTDDVAGFAQAKLRLLNGAHSTLAYTGLLRGHETVREAMDDMELAAFVRTLMLEDIAPTLKPPRALNVTVYVDQLLARFRNGALRHLLSQIAWDGSQKLPVRILGTVRDAAAAGRPLYRLAVPVAAWMCFVRKRANAGVAIVDPLADTLASIGKGATGDAHADVERFLALDSVFGRDVPPAYVEALVTAYGRLSQPLP